MGWTQLESLEHLVKDASAIPAQGQPFRVDMSDRDDRIAWFKATILPHEPVLRRHLRRIGVNGMEIEIDDIVAEALARAYEIEDCSRIDRGRSYLFSIARNLVLDAARRRKIVAFDTFADVDALNLVDEQASVEATVTAREELRRLQKAVDRLPPRPREVFLLRRIEDLTVEQVAVRLSISVSTVEKHFTRAMVQLTEAMAEHDPLTGAQRHPAWRNARTTR